MQAVLLTSTTAQLSVAALAGWLASKAGPAPLRMNQLCSGTRCQCSQVSGLRAGRFYAARIVATASCTYAVGEEQQLVEFAASSSEILTFRTQPTPPGQMQAPALAQRARTALKVGCCHCSNVACWCPSALGSTNEARSRVESLAAVP